MPGFREKGEMWEGGRNGGGWFFGEFGVFLGHWCVPPVMAVFQIGKKNAKTVLKATAFRDHEVMQ